MSIRFKVILPYLVLTLIVAITGAYIVTRLVSSSLTERLSNQLLQAGRVVSDQLVQREIRHVEDARVIAFTVGVAEALQAGDVDRVSSLAGPAVGGQDIESLLVFDAQGHESAHLIGQSNGEIMNVSQPGRAAELPFVLDLLQEANPDSLPRRALEKDPVDGRYYYFTALPVAFEGQFAGVVVVGTSLNTIMPQLKGASLADVILYGDDSQAVASTLDTANEQGLFQRTISIPDEFYQSVLTSQDVVLGENIEVNERWYRLAYGPLQMGSDRLGVFAVVLPLDLVVDASQNNRNNYVLITILATIAVVLVGYLIARLIVNPLLKLVQVSLAIARGDLSRRTGIRTSDEIGVLANTFDEMTENLQQRTHELEKTNQVLEQMDRTKTRFIQEIGRAHV